MKLKEPQKLTEIPSGESLPKKNAPHVTDLLQVKRERQIEDSTQRLYQLAKSLRW